MYRAQIGPALVSRVLAEVIPVNGEQLQLQVVLDNAWIMLDRAVDQRNEHPFRTPTLATLDAQHGVQARTVVLREVSRHERQLFFHTDLRSPKVAQLRENPRCSWLFYDPGRRAQIRVQSHATLHTDDAVARQHWQNSSTMNRRTYMAPLAPGTPCAAPESNLATAFQARLPSDSESEAGHANFAVVSCLVDSLEWLELSATGYHRAIFHWAPSGHLTATWLAP